MLELTKPSEGKITTQNPDLMSFLNDNDTSKDGLHKQNNNSDSTNIMESAPLKRVYTESSSPAFTPEEEDQYRFVSSRIDDHDDEEEHVEEHVAHKPPLQPSGKSPGPNNLVESYAQSRGNTQTGYANQSRVNSRQNVQSRQLSSQPPDSAGNRNNRENSQSHMSPQRENSQLQSQGNVPSAGGRQYSYRSARSRKSQPNSAAQQRQFSRVSQRNSAVEQQSQLSGTSQPTSATQPRVSRPNSQRNQFNVSEQHAPSPQHTASPQLHNGRYSNTGQSPVAQREESPQQNDRTYENRHNTYPQTLSDPYEQEENNTPPEQMQEEDNEEQYSRTPAGDEYDQSYNGQNNQQRVQHQESYDEDDIPPAVPRDSLEEPDDGDLQQEEEYQKNLRERLHQQSLQDNAHQFPKLALNDSLEFDPNDLEETPRDSLDFRNSGGETYRKEEADLPDLEWKNPPPNPFDGREDTREEFNQEDEPTIREQAKSRVHYDSSVQDESSQKENVSVRRTPYPQTYEDDDEVNGEIQQQPMAINQHQENPAAQYSRTPVQETGHMDSHKQQHNQIHRQQQQQLLPSQHAEQPWGEQNQQRARWDQQIPPQENYGSNVPQQNFNRQYSQENQYLQGQHAQGQGQFIPQGQGQFMPQGQGQMYQPNPQMYRQIPQNIGPHGYHPHMQFSVQNSFANHSQESFVRDPNFRYPYQQPINGAGGYGYHQSQGPYQSREYSQEGYGPSQSYSRQNAGYGQQVPNMNRRSVMQGVPQDQYGYQQGMYTMNQNGFTQYQNNQNVQQDQYGYSQQGMHSQQDPYLQGQQLPDQNIAKQYSEAEDQNTNTQGSKRPANEGKASPTKPNRDYIQKNKEILEKGPEKKTYEKRFLQKKESISKNTDSAFKGNRRFENRAMSDGNIRRKPVNENDSKNTEGKENVDLRQKPNSAEDLWAKRSKLLTDHKKDRLVASGGYSASKGKKTTPLKKYPSESRVSDMRETSVVKPHRIDPIDHRPVPQTTDSPVMAQSPRRRPVELQPVTQTLWTEDGQRVSVDINLRLITPPPAQPLGAAPQHNRPVGPVFSPTHAVGNHYGNRAVGPIPQHPSQQTPPYYSEQSTDQYNYSMGRHPPAHFNNGYQSHDLGQYNSLSAGQAEMYQRQQQMHNQDVYPSPREGMEDFYQETPRLSHTHPQTSKGTTNPYQALPPIGSEEKGGKQSPSANTGSYMESFKKQKDKKTDYKAYTVNDYRKLKKEIKLGGLGPDFVSETMKEKAEKRQKQLEYAKQIKEQNRQEYLKKPPKAPKQESVEEVDVITKRKLALEYAKHVPKPKATQHVPSEFNSYAMSAAQSPIAQSPVQPRTSARSKTHSQKEQPIETITLHSLAERHKKEKEAAMQIQQRLQTEESN